MKRFFVLFSFLFLFFNGFSQKNIGTDVYQITLYSDPSGAGTLSGGGEHNEGERVSISAVANTGYRFVNWTEGSEVVSTSSSFYIIVNSDHVYTAHFARLSYEIQVSANPSSGGTVSGGGTYYYQDQATVVATPSTGYNFVNWTENGNVVSTNQTYSFEVTGSRSLVANFEIKSFNISVTAEPANGGQVQGGGTYTYGQSVTVTATPYTGYVFVGWQEGGNTVSTSQSYTFTATSNRDLVAVFTKQTFTVSATPNPQEGGSVAGAGTYEYGETATVSASANTGYDFVNWTENNSVVSTSPTYSFTVTQNHSLIANFKIQSFSISATVNPQGAGQVTGTGTYDYGTKATLTAIPATGYRFVNWTENGNVVSTGDVYSFTVTQARSLVANFEKQTYTVSANVYPSDAGTVQGTGVYEYGQTVQLTASAATGYVFSHWEENNQVVSQQNPYNFTVTSNRNLVAVFTKLTYTVSATANPQDGGSVAGAGTYEYGTVATLTATPATGYRFVNWTENGNIVSTDLAYSFTVTGSRSLVANFEKQTITVSATVLPVNSGTVEGTGTFEYGTEVTLVATPNTGYEFVNWTENGNIVSSSQTYSFTATVNRNLVANFKLQSFNITTEVNPEGTGEVSGAGTYNYGDEVTLVATPAEGYKFVSWTENGDIVSQDNPYTFTVSQPRVLTANFEKQVFTITATASPDNAGTVEGAGEYQYGQEVQLTASANEGYVFSHWEEDGQFVSQDNPLVFVAYSDENLVAVFAEYAAINSGNVLKLYPNPVDDFMVLYLDDAHRGYTVKVFDLTGVEKIRRSASAGAMRMDMSALSSGIYVVKILDEDGKIVAVKKVIKK